MGDDVSEVESPDAVEERTDSVEEWSLAWGGVVTAQGALSAAAGPRLEAQAASLGSLEAGDCAEYLRASMWALDTLGPQVDMPGLMVARANIEDVAREVATISAQESEPSESGGSWRRLTAALLAKGSPQLHWNEHRPYRHMPGSTPTAVELVPGPVHHTSSA